MYGLRLLASPGRFDGIRQNRRVEIPDHLTHYYRVTPFKSLTELEPGDADDVVRVLAGERALPFRLTHPDYLARRREIEGGMRDLFARTGGEPQTDHPCYLILGRSSAWEQLEPRSIRIPLATIPDELLSFTFTDSFFAFSSHNLHGAEIPAQPFHRQVFRQSQLPELVAEFGLPGIAPGDRLHPLFDPYVEAQLWCSPDAFGWLRAPHVTR